jgi:hypothetical protein
MTPEQERLSHMDELGGGERGVNQLLDPSPAPVQAVEDGTAAGLGLQAHYSAKVKPQGGTGADPLT